MGDGDRLVVDLRLTRGRPVGMRGATAMSSSIVNVIDRLILSCSLRGATPFFGARARQHSRIGRSTCRKGARGVPSHSRMAIFSRIRPGNTTFV